MIRAFVVSAAEILAQETRSLLPTDYDIDAKRAGLLREAGKLRVRASLLIARAEKLEAQANAPTPNRSYPVEKE